MTSRVLVSALLVASCAIADAQPAQPPPDPPAPAAPDVDESVIDRVLAGITLDDAARVVHGTLQRARRAGTFGPFVAAGAAAFDGSVDGALAAGLAAGVYDVPVVPSTALIKDVIRARVKARLVERVRTAVAGGQQPPLDTELAALAAEIVEGVKAEVLAELAVRPRRLERPKLLGHFEVGYWPRAAGWQTRVTLLFGLGPLAIGPTAGVQYDASLDFGVGFVGGAELVLPVQLSSGPRSHPLHLFVRGEAGTAGTDNVTFGARLMLDLI